MSRQILHLVLVRLSAGTSDRTLKQLRENLRSLVARVDGVVSLDEGESVSSEGLEDGMDYAFAIRFAERHHLDAYLAHPVHVSFGAALSESAERILVFDLPGRAPVEGCAGG